MRNQGSLIDRVLNRRNLVKGGNNFNTNFVEKFFVLTSRFLNPQIIICRLA
jgi:hypothetical protein